MDGETDWEQKSWDMARNGKSVDLERDRAGRKPSSPALAVVIEGDWS